jgi:CheY-like chemotaxis protein
MNYIPGSPFVKQIKEIEPEIPIIALSTFNDSIDPLYFEKIIYKPVNKVKLLDTLYNIINKNDITPFQINELTETKFITLEPKLEPKLEPIKCKEIKILVAEDVSYNLEMLVKMLNTMDYKNIDTAQDGEEAISKLEKNTYDIVLLDLKMPKKTGFEVAEYINSKKLNCKITVISASVLDKDRNRCKDLGIKYFFLKPFSMTNLRIMMNKLINSTK